MNGYVQQLIEAADLEASLIAERALVINLRGLMISKEANNTERSIVALKASSDLYASHKTPNELLISDIVAKDPGMIEMEAKKAGIADFHWHDLRHTFATRLREAGVDIYTLMRLTRRRDIKMVMRYAHHSDRSLREVAEKGVTKNPSVTPGATAPCASEPVGPYVN